MDLFVLRAVLGLDTSEYDKGIDDAGKKASTFGDMLKANLVTKGIDVAVRGMKKLGQVTADVITQSVNAYADYEQLVGGVETLFKGSANTVQQYAQEAYKTAGLSANEYMETVTSFSASLIQSLGGDTQKAADLADLAIRDMSDNANKMGTDMSSIQAAYQGFAKQNYTMLDNLKLGYGGTKSEMERLIKRANQLRKAQGKAANLTINSYADIVEAIHEVQNEMDITGTTAEEAERTISGSLRMVKSSWQNLLTAIAEGNTSKIEKMVDDFVDSAEKYADNLFPVVEKAIDGLATLIERLAPKIEEKLPGILERITPSLIKVTGALITTIAKVLTSPETINTIFQAAKQVVTAVFNQLKDENPELLALLGVAGGVKVAGTVSKAVNTGSKIVGAGKSLLGIGGGAVAGKAVAGKAAAAGAGGAVAGAALVGSAAAIGLTGAYYDKKYKEASKAQKTEIDSIIAEYEQLYETKGKAVADNWAQLTYSIDTNGLTLEQSQAALMGRVIDLWGDVPTNIWDATVQGWDHYFGANGEGFLALLYDAFIKGPKAKFGELFNTGKEWAIKFAEGHISAWENLKQAASGTIDIIENAVKGPINDAITWGKTILNNITTGISTGWTNLKTTWDKITNWISSTIGGVVDSALSWGADLWNNFLGGLEQGWKDVKDWFTGALDWIKARIGFSEPSEGPLSDFHTYAPDMMKLFAQGIRDNAHLVTEAADDSLSVHPGMSGTEFRTPVTGSQDAGRPIILTIDGREFARIMLPYNAEEQQRVGVRLAGVMV